MDIKQYETLISDRIAELTKNIRRIEKDLEQPLDSDLEDQAIDLEDDEVLEGIAQANQQEVRLLGQALDRIKDGTYGICQKCGDDISPERLNAVLYAQVCRVCAAQAEASR
ncbi:TraR/DksA family transcriptional regulator [Yoonia sediminilitoris]|uniref:TraR/DksA family transcriptional regulator n=1 Tax=Yoonia sediminilitoris TaxID=1286148 RepID=A0A2T6KIT5_9RHOB|nr:TraR/DksA C4-type zinc finger protein [Yoonia sediminilitoris]PUB15635.1 TraR/DksA family transcriptional regulator [Yoonia sediminilitoris]RCW96244.1 TraR/DksA family transcriptional regulator [Yoonia sediminilitoris]